MLFLIPMKESFQTVWRLTLLLYFWGPGLLGNMYVLMFYTITKKKKDYKRTSLKETRAEIG